jgi:hypothetical protein
MFSEMSVLTTATWYKVQEDIYYTTTTTITTCVRLRLLLAPPDPLAPDWNRKEETVLILNSYTKTQTSLCEAIITCTFLQLSFHLFCWAFYFLTFTFYFSTSTRIQTYTRQHGKLLLYGPTSVLWRDIQQSLIKQYEAIPECIIFIISFPK